MIKNLSFGFMLILFSISANCQNLDEYQVYALKLHDGSFTFPARDYAVGANPKDSIQGCFMVWLLKGENGKNILVDAGYLDTAKTSQKLIKGADLALQKINVYPDDITDIIITHPHYDHIGGITLFPKAKIWMNKDDFHYFVGEAWQENGKPYALLKDDVRNIIDVNLQRRLNLVSGDDIEIMPGIRAYTGSKHSYENMYLVVNSNSNTNKILLASDAIWLYYNLDNLFPATLCLDPDSYVEAMKRIKTLVPDPKFIIPGHDDLIFSIFPRVADGVVKIGN
ncbi:MAG: MBL fold metallo-hydrolase [Bacteroidales bacterium]|jgi:glyoxylase-like metal-dependent hydrolase (beta-lactamase superfamily II)|nr:MBL fold metallo-hydrolase [Bacteroidales bacterium]